MYIAVFNGRPALPLICCSPASQMENSTDLVDVTNSDMCATVQQVSWLLPNSITEVILMAPRAPLCECQACIGVAVGINALAWKN